MTAEPVVSGEPARRTREMISGVIRGEGEW